MKKKFKIQPYIFFHQVETAEKEVHSFLLKFRKHYNKVTYEDPFNIEGDEIAMRNFILLVFLLISIFIML